MALERSPASYESYAKLRDSADMNDHQVAMATKISKSMFSEWKNGKCSMGITNLLKLSGFFGVPVEYFIKKD